MDTQKLNNKGITLVELLIAIAIGSIVVSALVILLNQGINAYSKQTISAQLQDDANITLNQMTDAIMEAECIDIYNVASDSGNTPSFITKMGANGNAYSYDQTNKILYVGTTTAILTDYSKSGMLCKNVENFNIQILNSSVKIKENKIITINNPIQIKVSLTLQYQGIKREVSRVVSLRNKLYITSPIEKNLTIQGKLLNTFPDKSALNAYFTD